MEKGTKTINKIYYDEKEFEGYKIEAFSSIR